MKRILITLAAMATMAFAASCQKELVQLSNSDNSTAVQDEISIRAVQGNQTKSAVSGTDFPVGYDMRVSAFYIPDNSVKVNNSYPENNTPSDYFTDIAFAKGTGDTWVVKTGKKFWPLAGTLNFLAVAGAGLNTAANGIVPTFTWGEQTDADKEAFSVNGTSTKVKNSSAKAVLTMPTNAAKFDDFMFANANGVSKVSAGVSMCFQHAYSSIVFVAKSNVAYDGTNNYGITIDRISVNNTKSTGTLTITNNRNAVAPASPLNAVWSDLGGELATLYAHKWTVNTGVKGDEATMQNLELGTTATVINTAHPFGDGYVLVPEQAVTSFTIEYTIHNGKKGDNSADNRKMKYTYNCAGTGTGTNNGFWQMGKKYIYSINLTLNEITIAPTVQNWDANTIPVQIPESKNYLTFSAPSYSTVRFENYTERALNFQYSKDLSEWKTWDLSDISFGGDTKVYIRGINPEGIGSASDLYGKFYFLNGMNISCKGDIMSLIDYREISDEIPSDYCFTWLFRGCTKLIEAPTLSAVKLTPHCYDQMFTECENLVTVQDVLPATVLAEACYSQMYTSCKKLEKAPELPAPTLVTNCYYGMLSDTKITSLKCLATSGIEAGCDLWLRYVPESGTFIKKSGVTWPSGDSGIPEGWTVEAQ